MAWQEWVNGILGLWVILAAYLYVPSGTGMVLMVITGLVMAVLSFWGVATISDYSENKRRQQIQN